MPGYRFTGWSDKMTESEQQKADRKHFKKCWPGFHHWEERDTRGLIAMMFLRQCRRCSWWSVTQFNGYDSQVAYFAPSRFEKEPEEVKSAEKKPTLLKIFRWWLK